MIRRSSVSATGATGGAGTATVNASTTEFIRGIVLDVYLAYLDSPPSTTDITVAEQNNSPGVTVLTVSNANTDGWFRPRKQVHNDSGTALTYDGTRTVNEPLAVCDHLKVTIAQANNGDGVTATILWDDLK